MSNHFSENRLQELVADKVIFGLDRSQEEEMENLIGFSDETELQSFEIAAAIVDLSMLSPEPMPESLEKKLMRQGRAALEEPNEFEDEFDASESENRLASNVEGRSDENDMSMESRTKSASTSQPPQSLADKQRIREIFAWGCAAAIGFVALMVWNNNRNTIKSLNEEVAGLKVGEAQAKKTSDKLSGEIVQLEKKLGDARKREYELTVANNALERKLSPDGRELFDELVASEDTIRWKWSPGNQTDTKASGEVLWDEELQKGVMRLVDLKKNDPQTSQYQLWIIEENGRPHPVDGGIFDIETDGEVFIPIDAKLFASKPSLFAITEEDPKGVVVSGKAKLHLLAKANE